MPKLPNYPIIVRRCKNTDSIVLFMVDKIPNRTPQLSCFSWSEGHGQASLEYYRNDTVPAHVEDAQAHFKRYTQNWEGESIPVLRKVIPRNAW